MHKLRMAQLEQLVLWRAWLARTTLRVMETTVWVELPALLELRKETAVEVSMMSECDLIATKRLSHLKPCSLSDITPLSTDTNIEPCHDKKGRQGV
jgi:hypothetical protein